MKSLKKGFKFLLIGILLIIILANLIILFSGRLYIYKGISSTYFRGYTGPSIYDHDVFETREVKKGLPQPWHIDESKSMPILDQKDQLFIESLNPASFIVAWGDTIIYESYWNNHTVTKTGNSFSMSKSVIALLIGVAIDEGYIKSIDEPVGKYLPEFKNEKSNITIRHILTMSSGLSWSENYVHPFCDVAELYYDTDARELALNRRIIEEKPGITYRYKSGDTQVLMYILNAATGQNITEYASKKIWQKIGAESDASWSLVDGAESEEKAYCCLYATSRDFAKLGRLINNNGKWKGSTIVSQSYLNDFKSLAPLKKANGKNNQLYGYQYWIYTGLPYEVTYFRGMKGQYIISVPSKDLVIVRTGMGTLKNWTNPAKGIQNDALEGHREEIPKYINIGLTQLEKYKRN